MRRESVLLSPSQRRKLLRRKPKPPEQRMSAADANYHYVLIRIQVGYLSSTRCLVDQYRDLLDAGKKKEADAFWRRHSGNQAFVRATTSLRQRTRIVIRRNTID